MNDAFLGIAGLFVVVSGILIDGIHRCSQANNGSLL
jgi:hypothetical protein